MTAGCASAPTNGIPDRNPTRRRVFALLAAASSAASLPTAKMASVVGADAELAYSVATFRAWDADIRFSFATSGTRTDDDIDW